MIYNYFKKIIRDNLWDESDHYPFAVKGVPFIYLTVDGVNKEKYYHSPFDTFSNFSSEKYDNLFNLITNFISSHKQSPIMAGNGSKGGMVVMAIKASKGGNGSNGNNGQ